MNKQSEKIEFMINAIKDKLKMINPAVLDPKYYSEDIYEDLEEIYELVMKKDRFSPTEMQAIVEELGGLRSK